MPQPLIIRTALWLLLAAGLLLTGVGCAGYHMGNQFLYRNDIRSVHVAIFETDSYRRFLGQRLTEAVVKQIESQTPLTISDPRLADSFVQGRILRDTKRVLSETRDDDPRALQYGWQLEVTWVDRAGVPLMQRQVLRIDEDIDFIPEGGQSLATAELEMVERLARQIVGQMEIAW
ncbi:MAG: LPS assembly lipoprotein LptE [Planctomycetota bacterium]